MSNTYGSSADFPDVTVQTTGGSMSDPVQEMVPGISLWGHSIVLDGESGIKCQSCDMEEEIPELLSMSSGFREVVYKMYILGKFRQEKCNSDPEDIEEMMDDLDRGRTNWPDNARHRVDPNKIHWSGNTTTISSAQSDTVDMYFPKGQRMMVEGTPYIYHGNGTWIDEDNNIPLDTIDLFEKHGQQAEKHFPPEIVQEKKDKLQSRKQLMKQQSLDKVGIGDVKDDVGPQIQGNQVNQSQNHGINIDGQVDDKTAAEKFASKLSESKNHFLRR